jgi:amino acid transporter
MATPTNSSGNDLSGSTAAGSTTTGSSSAGSHRLTGDTGATERVDMARETSTTPTQRTERVEHVTQVQPPAPAAQQPVQRRDDSEARDRFGGINWGAGFFGWLVAIGMTIILSGIVGAVLTAIGSQIDITLQDAKSAAGSIGIGAGITLLVVLMLAYFTGGYVAGRMSRFDGAKQGVAVWVIGLVVTLLVAAVGAIAGDKYNIFSRISLPRLPLNLSELGTGGAITAVAVLLGTLLAAVVGGKIGHRYHDKVDRAAGISSTR